MDALKISYNKLPPSSNNYLIPVIVESEHGNKPSLVESYDSKRFKREFGTYLKRLVKMSKWNVEDTKEGHWYLDCVFVQARSNQDNSNFFKILLDSMTGIVINDDKNVLPRVQKVQYNSKSPRMMLRLSKAPYVGAFANEVEFLSFESKCESCSRYRKGRCAILTSTKDNKEQSDISVNSERVIECLKYKSRA